MDRVSGEVILEVPQIIFEVVSTAWEARIFLGQEVVPEILVLPGGQAVRG